MSPFKTFYNISPLHNHGFLIFPEDSAHARKYKGAKPKGVVCRNKALKWIRENAHDGVLYFADDDNTYDIDLFREVSTTSEQNSHRVFPIGGLCPIKNSYIQFSIMRTTRRCAYTSNFSLEDRNEPFYSK